MFNILSGLVMMADAAIFQRLIPRGKSSALDPILRLDCMLPKLQEHWFRLTSP
jgi:hypothetical protein